MAIQELSDSNGLILSELHVRIAVVKASPRQRDRARAQLQRLPGVAVIDASDVLAGLNEERPRLKALHADTVARHEARVAELRKARHDAGERLASASAAVEAALSSLDDFDRAEEALGRALVGRDRATAAEAVEARRLAAVLERRERLTRQRDDAMRAIQDLEVGGPVRRSAEMRRQVAQLEVGLARAEAEQTRAERIAEASLHQARAARLAAAAELDRADRGVRADLAGFPGVAAGDWPAGPPLPVLLTERRDRLAGVLGELYAATSAARTALDAAGVELRAAERELEEARQGAVTLIVGSVVETRLGGAGSRPEVIVCDEPFVGIEMTAVGAVLERLVQDGGTQVIYLTEDPHVLAWAEGLPSESGGVCVSRSDEPAATCPHPPADAAGPSYIDPSPALIAEERTQHVSTHP
ncbi:MAG TPA: hypothetical protein VFH58_05230 [Acidimicrobiales bacterium]|nr:hypothetical protein [Acidimicrobiales bacterium]